MKEEIKDFGGAYQVGGYGIKGMIPHLAHSMVYAIEGKDSFLLIDCGNGFTGREIWKNLSEVSPKTISYIFLTHCHYDHSLNSLFFKERGVKIFSHISTSIAFKEKTHKVWYEYPHLVKPFDMDITFSSDDKFLIEDIEIQTFYTPGHTDGCASYLVSLKNRKFLFTGDLIMPDGEIGWAGSEDFNKERLLESLEKIESLEFDFLLGGHHYSDGKEGKENIRYALEKGKKGEWKILKDYHY